MDNPSLDVAELRALLDAVVATKAAYSQASGVSSFVGERARIKWLNALADMRNA